MVDRLITACFRLPAGSEEADVGHRVDEIDAWLDERDLPTNYTVFVEIGPQGAGDRPLRQAVREAKERGALLLVDGFQDGMKVKPAIAILGRSNLPLLLPEVPTYQQTRPLTRYNLQQLRRFARSMDSKRRSKVARRSTSAPGGDTGHVPDPETTEKAREALQQAADEAAQDRYPAVKKAYEEAESYTGAAKLLNEQGVMTLSGSGSWHPQTVKRTLERVEGDEEEEASDE